MYVCLRFSVELLEGFREGARGERGAHPDSGDLRVWQSCLSFALLGQHELRQIINHSPGDLQFQRFSPLLP